MQGFLNIHQFLNGAQFRKFDPFKMHPPAEWEMVETILKHVPAASRETFKRFFYAKDYLIDSCLSISNISQGYIKTGFNRTDGGNGPNYVQMLKNCPEIVSKCPPNKLEAERFYDEMLCMCEIIAKEIIEDPYSRGTPDDIQMEGSFSSLFGHVHIGTNKEKSSHSRVTDLEFIRWRATVFGTDGQRILAAARTRNFAGARLNNRERDATTAVMPTTAVFGKGKYCSNPSCPLKSRYSAATCKTLWRKCDRTCSMCEGRTHVCPHEDCLKIVEGHK